jgi:hypothetical protein
MFGADHDDVLVLRGDDRGGRHVRALEQGGQSAGPGGDSLVEDQSPKGSRESNWCQRSREVEPLMGADAGNLRHWS